MKSAPSRHSFSLNTFRHEMKTRQARQPDALSVRQPNAKRGRKVMRRRHAICHAYQTPEPSVVPPLAARWTGHVKIFIGTAPVSRMPWMYRPSPVWPKLLCNYRNETWLNAQCFVAAGSRFLEAGCVRSVDDSRTRALCAGYAHYCTTG